MRDLAPLTYINLKEKYRYMLLLIVTCNSIGLHFIIFIVVSENKKKTCRSF